MKTIRRRLTNQVISRVDLLGRPFMLQRQLMQSLPLGQRPLDALHAAQGVILRLVKDPLALHDLENAIFPLQCLSCVQQFGKVVDRDVGLGTLVLEQLGALGARGLQCLDPGGRRVQHGDTGKNTGKTKSGEMNKKKKMLKDWRSED